MLDAPCFFALDVRTSNIVPPLDEAPTSLERRLLSARGVPTRNVIPQHEETTANPERHLLFGT